MLQGWLLWFALTAAFSLMGFGMAAFQGSLYVSGTMGTAEAKACFSGNPHLYVYKLAERGQGDDSTTVTEEQSAGSITHEVVITNAETKNTTNDSEKNNAPILRAEHHDDKNIAISIAGAYPGDVYTLQYTIENTGTIPVMLDLGSISDHPQLKVENSLHRGEFLGPGERADEVLTITIGENAKGGAEYRFSVELNYRQWNAN